MILKPSFISYIHYLFNNNTINILLQLKLTFITINEIRHLKDFSSEILFHKLFKMQPYSSSAPAARPSAAAVRPIGLVSSERRASFACRDTSRATLSLLFSPRTGSNYL